LINDITVNIMPPPLMTDQEIWRNHIIAHRRVLLEKVIAAFPEVLRKKKTQVDILRASLRPPFSAT
jgi:hypothetical protein